MRHTATAQAVFAPVNCRQGVGCSTWYLPSASSDLTRWLQVIQHVVLFAGLRHRLDSLDQLSVFQGLQDLGDLWLWQVGLVLEVLGPYACSNAQQSLM